MTYSGWLRHNFPTGASEGDTYKCLSTKEVFTYTHGQWVKDEPLAPAPENPKPKTIKKKASKK